MKKQSKKIVLSPEEMVKQEYDRGLKEANYNLKYYINEPTRQFEIGEHVRWGGHDKIQIVEIFAGGKFYYVRCYGLRNVYGKPTNYEEHHFVFWNDLFKIRDYTNIPQLRNTDKLEIQFHNTTIDSLLSKCYRGVDFNPDYQRELIWDLEDKISLIDSIFNNIEIGKFAFIEKYSCDEYDSVKDLAYEILDGKQRINALMEFFEDRFQYKGFYFSELKSKDKHHFLGFPITVGETKDPKDKKRIYQYFIKLNTCGKSVSKEHLDKIKAKLNAD